jgi:MFS transporter, DHA2 family, multidrug resistance protein
MGASEAGAEEAPGTPQGAAQARAVLAWSLGYTVTMLSGGMVGAALPVIAAAMDISPADSIWILSAYGIAYTAAILPAAALADSIGYRAVFIGGSLLFAVSSLLAALSPSYEFMIAMRVVQGVGTGGAIACLGHFIRAAYPPERMGRGLAFNAMQVAAASGGGPAIAGLILGVASWPWVFGLGAVQAFTAVVLGRRWLPPSRATRERIDYVSAVLNAVVMGLLVLGFQSFAHDSPVLASSELLLAILVGAVFVRRELRSPKPMLGVDLLRIPVIRLSAVTMIICFAGQGMIQAALPFFLHLHRSGSALQLGLLLATAPIGAMAIAPLAGRLADRYPVGAIGGAGMALFGVSVLLIAVAPVQAGFWDLAWRIFLSGAGFALFGPTNTRGMIMGAPKSRTGAATGLNATLRALANTLGGSAAAVVFGFMAGGGATLASTQAVLLAVAAMALAGALLSLARLRVGEATR